MNRQTFVQVATVIFIIVGLGHLYRAFYNLPLNIAGWDAPVLLSWVGGLVLLFLAYTGYKHWK